MGGAAQDEGARTVAARGRGKAGPVRGRPGWGVGLSSQFHGRGRGVDRPGGANGQLGLGLRFCAGGERGRCAPGRCLFERGSQRLGACCQGFQPLGGRVERYYGSGGAQRRNLGLDARTLVLTLEACPPCAFRARPHCLFPSVLVGPCVYLHAATPLICRPVTRGVVSCGVCGG